MRTPIHGILASTEILRGSQLTSAQRSLISAIQSAGTNVIHIADHILRVSNTVSQILVNLKSIRYL